MAETSIEWTRGDDGTPGVTWNCVTGCDQVSPGCDLCYAKTMAKRLKAMGQVKYQNDGDPRTSGPGFGLTVHPDTLDLPFKWKKPRRVFVNSMSDLFHKDVPVGFIQKVWDVMADCPQHTFQLLTKRSQRMADLIGVNADGPLWTTRQGEVIPNAWLGCSVESDRYMFRADHLRNTAAALRFLSLEPLLGPLPSLDLTGIGWVIVGGESGPGARPMHPDWVRDIRDRCIAAGVPFFMKQWGAWQNGSKSRFAPGPVHDRVVLNDGRCLTWDEYTTAFVQAPAALNPVVMSRVGKKAAGNELDGRTWTEFPCA